MKILLSGLLWNLFKSFEQTHSEYPQQGNSEKTDTYGWTIDAIKIATASKGI